MVVRFYDHDKVPIPPDYGDGAFGIEGGQSREDSWTATVTQDQLDRACSIAVCNFFDPQYSAGIPIWGWVAQNAQTIISIAVAIASA